MENDWGGAIADLQNTTKQKPYYLLVPTHESKAVLAQRAFDYQENL